MKKIFIEKYDYIFLIMIVFSLAISSIHLYDTIYGFKPFDIKLLSGIGKFFFFTALIMMIYKDKIKAKLTT